MAVGPSSTGASVDVIMRFLLDEQANARVAAGISSINDELERLEKQQGDVSSASDDATKALEKESKALEGTKKAAADTNKELQNTISNFSKLSSVASRAAAISQGIFAVGAGTVGGIFAVAQNYVKNAEQATTVTRAWKAETEALQRSGARVGAVFAEQALPTLRQAAELAEKASRFIERNPEIIQAALKTGLVVAALGAVGTAVARGIKLVADIGYIAATANQLLAGRTMQQAGKDMLVSAGIMSKTGGLTPGVAGATRALGTVVLTATSVIIGAEVGAILGNKIGEAITGGSKNQIVGRSGPGRFGVGDAATASLMLLQTPAYLVVKAFNEIGLVSNELIGKYRDSLNSFDRFIAGLLGANKMLEILGKADVPKRGVSGTTSFGGGLSADVVNAYTQFREAGIQAEKSYQSDRLSILRDANNAALAVNKNYASSVKQINATFSKTILSITRDAQQAELRASEDYANQRQQVIRDSGQEIQRIEEDLQENLRKIALESDQRIQDLVANRDALGIVRERRKRDQEMEEATRAANIEIGRRRQDLAVRLNDMAQEFQLERQRRREEFEQRIQEAEAQRQEELKRAAEQRAEELKQIQEAKAAKLRELNAQYREEQIRLRDAFIAKIRDLDASLLGEQQLRRAYYAQMLIDARNWLSAYRGALAGGSTGTTGGHIPTHAAGGYTAGGLALMHPKEFVLDRSTTKAAEDVIGGRLNQSNMRGMLAGAGGTTINLEFPGGLVTMKSLRNILEDNNSDLLKTITDALR